MVTVIVKQRHQAGHWLLSSEYVSVSSGDIENRFQQLRRAVILLLFLLSLPNCDTL
jgi:hypothetical protein